MGLLDLFYFLLGGLLFWGIRRMPKGEWNGDYTSREQTGALRGAAALGVMLHHMAQKTCAPWNPSAFIVHGLDVFLDIGYIFVSVYFFLSGLGLYKRLRSKQDYLKAFFRRRVLPLAVAFYLSEWICLAVRLLMGERMKTADILWNLTGLRLANPNAWFMVTLPLFYLFFWLAFRFSRSEKAAILKVFALVVAYTVGCAFVDHQDVWWIRGEWWYNSVILFPLGLLYARHEEKLTAAFKKRHALWLCFSLALAAAAWMFSAWAVGAWGYYGENWDSLKVLHRLGSASSQWLVCAAMVWTLLLFMMKCHVGNAALRWIGNMSMDLYLVHGTFAEMFGFDFMGRAKSLPYIRSVPLYITAVFLCSAFAAVLFRLLRKGVMKLFPEGRRGGEGGERPPKGGPEGDPKEGRQKRAERPGALRAELPTGKKIMRLAVPVLIAAAAVCAWLFFDPGAPANRVSGMNVPLPEGFSCTFRERDCMVWNYEGQDRRPGPLVINTEIRGSHAQVFCTVEEVLADCAWLKEAEIYVNPHGVRMVRGYSMDYSGYPEYRYYVETPSAVFLMSMSENTEYYEPRDCEALLLEAADGISPA
ncbi:MAG: acyltransferase [Clostridia bacterium]|nr:acyltransferase [Clostridia bacterium]